MAADDDKKVSSTKNHTSNNPGLRWPMETVGDRKVFENDHPLTKSPTQKGK